MDENDLETNVFLLVLLLSLLLASSSCYRLTTNDDNNVGGDEDVISVADFGFARRFLLYESKLLFFFVFFCYSLITVSGSIPI